MARSRSRLRQHIDNAVASGLIGVALMLPYEARVRFFGWVVSTLVAPVAGWRKRIRENLAIAVPDLPEGEVEALVREVCDNVGRTLIEIYSGEAFLDRVEASSFVGPGVAALERLRAEGRPVVFLTAHMGNYDAVRGALARRGRPMAALYKPMKNEMFNKRYVRAISTICTPVYPTDARGIAGLVRHLKKGGDIGIVGDVSRGTAPILTFFGQPAHTPVSAAEWAKAHGAALVPIFGLRNADGLTFRIHVAEPVAEGTPEDMMQRYNDVVEAVVRENMGQWFWIHRRWQLWPDGLPAADS